MSIFKKDCPECATANSIDAVRCDCGYYFDPEALAGTDAAEYQDEQDRLYVDYLAARIVQAEIEARVAREQANIDPSNTLKAAAALVAEQALNALNAEMKQYELRLSKAKRVTAAKTAAKPIPAPAPVAKTPVASTPRFGARAADMPPPRAAAKKHAKPATPKSTTARKSSPRPLESKPAAAATPSPRAIEIPKATPTVAKPAPKVAPVATKKPEPIAAKMVASLAPRPSPASAPKSTTEPAKPKSTAVPTTHFRQLQAKKAEAITRGKVTVNPVVPAKPVVKEERAAQTPVARPTVQKHDPTKQQCPSCTAMVAMNLTQCSCGYVFSQLTDVPALVLETPIVVAPINQEAMQECPNCTATLPASRKQCNCGYTFSQATEQVPALALDAGALAILNEGIGGAHPHRRR